MSESIPSRLRAHLFAIALVAIGGAVVGFVIARLQPTAYRAVATLLVVEPRVAGSYNAVDYQLTPIRSYRPLFRSPELAATCYEQLGRPAALAASAAALGDGIDARMPENTRLLEITFEAGDAELAARFVNCVAGAAIERNRRLNADLALGVGALAEAAFQSAAERATASADALRQVRDGSRLEALRAEQRGWVAALEAASGRTLKAEIETAAAAARAKALLAERTQTPARRVYRTQLAEDAQATAILDGRPGTTVMREEADSTFDWITGELARARADESADRAEAKASAEWASQAARRVQKLEAEIAALDVSQQLATKRFEGAAAALLEAEKRRALAGWEAATKAFDLALLAPAAAPSAPARPKPKLAALAGALAAGALAAIWALGDSRS